MPFSGPSDKKLPSNVRKLPLGKRRQWVATWNSVFRNCRKTGSVKLCETRAFRIANGTVKGKDMNEALKALTTLRDAYTEGDKADGDKAGLMDAAIADLTAQEEAKPADEKCLGDEIVIAARPFGGAISFSDFDKFEDARDTEFHVKEMSTVFRMIVDNIFTDEEMTLEQKAAAVVSAATELGTRVKETPQESKSFLEKVKDFISIPGKPAAPAHPEGSETAAAPGVFASFKDFTGRWRWMIINTNKFEDREGETFTEKAHKEYIHYVERTGDFPELWLWHTPGTRLGKADLVDYVDGFVIHTGLFDPGFEDVAERLALMGKTVGVSHGFAFIAGDEEDKVYDHYRTFELTLCPAHKSANIWGTEFESFTKEVTMGFSDEKRAFFVEALGEERTATLEEKLPALSKELEKEGVNFKDLVEDLLPAPAPAKEEVTDKKEAEEAAPAEKPSEAAAPAGDPDLAQRVSTIESTLEGLGANLKELVDSNKTLVDSIGAKITEGVDAALTGRKTAPSSVSRPSEIKETELSEEEAAKVTGGSENGASKAATPYIDDLVGGGAVKS